MIEIVPYQPRWTEEFLTISEKIENAVGKYALAIHHIGSTSVPNLAAKDVIDIQITVKDLTLPLEGLLSAIGFELTQHTVDHCPPGMKIATEELEKRAYRGKGRRVNLHVRKQGSFNQRYPILFRDFLRANPMARDAYSEIKKQLARYFPENVDAYYDIKDPACDLIIAGAIEWARTNHWEPGLT